MIFLFYAIVQMGLGLLVLDVLVWIWLISHYADDINKYFENGSEVLPSNNKTKEYDLIETEVYKIIIE